jgi:hypothetical protein
VDISEGNVDNDVSAFIFQNKYDGEEYRELRMLKTAMKSHLRESQVSAQSSRNESSNVPLSEDMDR